VEFPELVIPPIYRLLSGGLDAPNATGQARRRARDRMSPSP
jgi:hypothetical protein